MVATLIFWAAMLGGAAGYYGCWRWGKGREKDNKDVAFIKALGEMMARANGTFGLQQPVIEEAEPEIWYSDVQDELDPYMENEDVQ